MTACVGDAAGDSIPLVDVAPLFDAQPPAGEAADRALAAAARDIRFVCVRGRVARTLLRSLTRSLGLPPEYFDESFRRGLSTLRLIRYPPRDPAELAAVQDPSVWVPFQGVRRYLIGAPHTDSGFVTLLAQDGVAGLQARSRSGEWVDVPPLEGTLVVNFGQVLEQWSAGRIRATEHRVLGTGRARMRRSRRCCSIRQGCSRLSHMVISSGSA